METPQGEDRLTIREMCKLAEVSRASYHRYVGEVAPDEGETKLRRALVDECLAHRREGYRRICRRLRRQDLVISPRRTGQLMRENNLLSLRRNKFVLPTTDSRHNRQVYPNLAKNLHLTGPQQLWVADITYVQLKKEEVYLAVVLDVFTRRVVGWAVRDNLTAPLVIEALDRALANRPVPQMHHSDRGVQYASEAYVQKLEALGVVISMSRPGTPTDNAHCESVIKTLKAEQLDGQAYRNLAEFAPALPKVIDVLYNQNHLHSALGYRTPAEFELLLKPQDAASGGGVF